MLSMWLLEYLAEFNHSQVQENIGNQSYLCEVCHIIRKLGPHKFDERAGVIGRYAHGMNMLWQAICMETPSVRCQAI